MSVGDMFFACMRTCMHVVHAKAVAKVCCDMCAYAGTSVIRNVQVGACQVMRRACKHRSKMKMASSSRLTRNHGSENVVGAGRNATSKGVSSAV